MSKNSPMRRPWTTPNQRDVRVLAPFIPVMREGAIRVEVIKVGVIRVSVIRIECVKLKKRGWVDRAS